MWQSHWDLGFHPRADADAHLDLEPEWPVGSECGAGSEWKPGAGCALLSRSPADRHRPQGAMACSRRAWQWPDIRKVTGISSCHSAPGKTLLNADKGHLYEAQQRLCPGMEWPEPQRLPPPSGAPAPVPIRQPWVGRGGRTQTGNSFYFTPSPWLQLQLVSPVPSRGGEHCWPGLTATWALRSQ